MKKNIITDYEKEGKITFKMLQEHKELIKRLSERNNGTLSKLIKQADKHDLTEEEQRACLRSPELKQASYLWHLNHEDERPQELFELVFIISFIDGYGIERLDDQERTSLKRKASQEMTKVGEVRSANLLISLPFNTQRFLFTETAEGQGLTQNKTRTKNPIS